MTTSVWTRSNWTIHVMMRRSTVDDVAAVGRCDAVRVEAVASATNLRRRHDQHRMNPCDRTSQIMNGLCVIESSQVYTYVDSVKLSILVAATKTRKDGGQ